MGWRTVEYRAGEGSDKIRLFRDVVEVRNLWSVGTVGPGLSRSVRHGSDAVGAWGLGWKG